MYKFAAEGPPWVSEFDYGQGKYERPSTYGSPESGTTNGSVTTNIPEGLGLEDGGIRVGLKNQPRRPIGNWMYGTDGMQPMDAGGPNLFPTKNKMIPLVSNESYPPPTAMPQNANFYPAMYNNKTGLRIDPQSGGMLMDDGVHRPKVHTLHDKHFNRNSSTGASMFSGLPHYLRNPSYGQASAGAAAGGTTSAGAAAGSTAATAPAPQPSFAQQGLSFASGLANTWLEGQTQKDIAEIQAKTYQQQLDAQRQLEEARARTAAAQAAANRPTQNFQAAPKSNTLKYAGIIGLTVVGMGITYALLFRN